MHDIPRNPECQDSSCNQGRHSGRLWRAGLVATDFTVDNLITVHAHLWAQRTWQLHQVLQTANQIMSNFKITWYQATQLSQTVCKLQVQKTS